MSTLELYSKSGLAIKSFKKGEKIVVLPSEKLVWQDTFQVGRWAHDYAVIRGRSVALFRQVGSEQRPLVQILVNAPDVKSLEESIARSIEEVGGQRTEIEDPEIRNSVASTIWQYRRRLIYFLGWCLKSPLKMSA